MGGGDGIERPTIVAWNDDDDDDNVDDDDDDDDDRDDYRRTHRAQRRSSWSSQSHDALHDAIWGMRAFRPSPPPSTMPVKMAS